MENKEEQNTITKSQDKHGWKTNGKNTGKRNRYRSHQRNNDPDKNAQNRNDPGVNEYWYYAVNDDIAKDVASLPYNILTGMPYEIKFNQNLGTKTGTWDAQIGQILILDYDCVPGDSTSKVAGVNMAATQLYTYIRHKNSGAKVYEAADAMMYVLAMRDIYAHIFEAKRALGAARFYPMVNRSIPDAIVNSMGFILADLTANAAAYRARLNLLIAQVNSFAVPKYFKVFLRTAFVASNIFADSNSLRGQFAIMRRMRYYTWNPKTSTQGTMLEAKPVRGTAVSNPIEMSVFLDQLEEMIMSLLLDQDAITISGDILKAFADGELYQVETMGEDYIVEPIYDENMTAQFENAVAADAYSGVTAGASLAPNLNIYQEDQLIQFSAIAIIPSGSSIIHLDSYLFNSHKDSPDFKDNLEWSRLMTMPYVTKAATADVTGTLEFKSGCEFVERMLIRQYNPAGDTDQTVYAVPQLVISVGALNNTYKELAILSNFDWHPTIYMSTSLASQFVFTFADLKVATVVDREVIGRMHDVANASVFYYGGSYDSAVKK